jgi:hypothetical protein
MSDYVPLYNFDSLELRLKSCLDRINAEVDSFFLMFPWRPDLRDLEQKKILDELMHEMWRTMSKISESMPAPEPKRHDTRPRDGTNPDPRCFRIREIVDDAYRNEKRTGQPALTEYNIDEIQELLFDITDEIIQLRNNSELPPGYKSRRAIGLLKSWRNGDTKDQQETLEALERLLVGENEQLAESAPEPKRQRLCCFDERNPDPRGFRIMEILENVFNKESITCKPSLGSDRLDEIQGLIDEMVDDINQPNK